MPVKPRLLFRSAALGLVFAAVFTGSGCGQSNAARVLKLADGTIVYFRGDTTVTPAPGFPHPRRIQIDGEALIKAPGAAEPLVLSSRLMEMSVTGEAVFREIAFAKQAGEQADIVAGKAVANKSYKSSYSIPDTLGAGDMVMVNQTIDLMEKERSDAQPLRDWIASIERDARDPSSP